MENITIIQLYWFAASSHTTLSTNERTQSQFFFSAIESFMSIAKYTKKNYFWWIMFTCFAVTWLFFVVYGISMCRCSPIRDCIVVHSHKPGRLQCESMKNVEDLTLLRHQNYNYYCCVDYCCCEIASIALMLYWIVPDSLFAKLAPCLIDTCNLLFFFFSNVSVHSKSLDWIN